jgi:hypothetical protein
MTHARALLLLLMPLCLSASWSARAETVWRCSGADGTRYSHQPCPGGQPVDLRDERSEAQRQAAREAAAKEAALADRMTREREQREARIQPSAAVGIRGERGVPASRSASAPTPLHKASASKTSKKKKKAPKPVKQPA